MSSIRIENTGAKTIYFERKEPSPPLKGEVEPGVAKSFNLGSIPPVKFSLYSETPNGKKHATYTDFTFKIGKPHVHQNVNISYKKSADEKELITEINWYAHGRQKSKDLLPPDNVEVGVKE